MLIYIVTGSGKPSRRRAMLGTSSQVSAADVCVIRATDCPIMSPLVACTVACQIAERFLRKVQVTEAQGYRPGGVPCETFFIHWQRLRLSRRASILPDDA